MSLRDHATDDVHVIGQPQGSGLIVNSTVPKMLDPKMLETVLPQLEQIQQQRLEKLWSESAIAVERMHLDHMEQVSQLQVSVAEFVEGSRRLEEENRSLQALMAQAVSCIQERSLERFQSPQVMLNPVSSFSEPFAKAVAMPQSGLLETAQTAFDPDLVSSMHGLAVAGIETPSTCERSSCEEVLQGAASSSPCDSPRTSLEASTHDVSTASSPQSSVHSSFSFTLRRVEDRPLGLLMRCDELEGSLIVEQVVIGSLVAAWNAQNVGDPREVLRDDRIRSINGHIGVSAMRNELMRAQLLKIEIERPEIQGCVKYAECF